MGLVYHEEDHSRYGAKWWWMVYDVVNYALEDVVELFVYNISSWALVACSATLKFHNTTSVANLEM